MIAALAALLVFQLLGEIVVGASGVPVPGPVAGMLLLFLVLRARGSLPPPLKTVSETLLSNLPLLFVPAGVGIIQHFSLLSREWLAILLALLVSTFLSLGATAVVMQTLARVLRRKGARG